VRSHTSSKFRKLLLALPEDVQRQAVAAYELWKNDHFHSGLHFKRVSPNHPYYSARVGLRWRVLGIRSDDDIVWIWIGPHAGYDHLLKRL
jgi:hypothetical protein